MSPADQVTAYERKILEVLDKSGATLAKDLQRAVELGIGVNQRLHLSAIRSGLVALEKKGLVRKLDDHTPVCWVKVRI